MNELNLTYDPATNRLKWAHDKAYVEIPYSQVVSAGGVGKIAWLQMFIGMYGRRVVIRSNLHPLNLRDVLYGPRIARKKIHRYFRAVGGTQP